MTQNIESKKDIRDQIVEDNYPLILSIAKGIWKPYYVEVEDLITDGYFGLEKAINNYDESFDVEFTTYAYSWIKGYMICGIKNESPLPIYKQDKIYLILSAEAKLIQQCKEISNESVAELCAMSVEEVKDLYGCISIMNQSSLESLEDEDMGYDVIDDSKDPEDLLCDDAVRETLLNYINSITRLNKTAKQIMIERFGLKKNTNYKTIKEVSKENKKSEEMVNMQLSKALRLLRLPEYINQMKELNILN